MRANFSFLNVASVALILFSVITPNFLVSVTSVLTINLIFRLNYKPGIPLVILGGLMFQWLQISVKVWHANFQGIPLNQTFSLYGGESNYESAFYLSSIGLVFLTVGIYTIVRKIDADSYFTKLQEELRNYDANKVAGFYILFSIFVAFLLSSRLVFPGLNTIIVAIGKLKWGFYTLFLLKTLVDRKKVRLFWIVTFFEIVLSFSGYFSDFKYFVIFAGLGLLSFTNVFTVRWIVLAIPAFYLLFYFAVIWTAVKGDYREYLSGGTDRQVVVVSKQEALLEFTHLVSNVNTTVFNESIDYFIDRLSFIEFFSLTLDNVPGLISHTGGELWSNAITFYLKPRLFFPNKPVIDDSEHTSLYTGLLLADSSGGASHSIGFMTDSYIDFGPIFMHFPIFLLGVMIGYLFKSFLFKSYNSIWGLVFTVPFFLLTSFYSFNLIKVIGNLFIYVIVVFIFKRFLISAIDPYIRKSQ